MKKIVTIFLLCTGLLAFLPFAGANAGFLTEATSKLQTSVGTPLEFESSLENSVSTVVKAALSNLGTIFFVLIVYAGILWMTAMGAEDRVTKAKSIITAAIIGLVIVMAAYAITYFVTSSLGGAGNGGGGGGGGGDGATEQGCCFYWNSDPDAGGYNSAFQAYNNTALWSSPDPVANDGACEIIASNYEDQFDDSDNPPSIDYKFISYTENPDIEDPCEVLKSESNTW